MILAGALVAAWSPAASAQSPKFTIEPYYVFPADQRYHAEYEQALRSFIIPTATTGPH